MSVSAINKLRQIAIEYCKPLSIDDKLFYFKNKERVFGKIQFYRQSQKKKLKVKLHPRANKTNLRIFDRQ